MSERTFHPEIHALPESHTILIDLGQDNYLRMSAEVAQKFAGSLMAKAHEAQGHPKAHMFVIEVPE